MLRERRFRHLWTAHPLQTLVESWALGLLIMLPLSKVTNHASAAVFTNGVLMICGACGLWMVFRTQLPEGGLPVQALWELVVALTLSAVLAGGLRFSTELLDWTVVWTRSSLGSRLTTILLSLTGVGYLVARVLVRLWHLWNQLRQRRMLLSITHAILTVAVLVMALLITFFVIATTLTADWNLGEPAESGLLAMVVDRVFLTLMPAVSVSLVMIALVVGALLPPTAMISYFIARRTTRRVDRLAQVTQAVRQGDYGARVAVEGEDEVAQLQTNFNAMADELESTLQHLQTERDRVSDLLMARRELIASVSHELRTPVATMRATLESLLARHQEDPPEASLGVVEGELMRLQRLIDDLFTLSRVEVDKLAFHLAPADVGPTIDQAVSALATLAWRSSRVEVVAEVPPKLPPVLVDTNRLQQVLANLLRNGVRHTPPGGIVAVMTAAEEDAVRIEVRDTGEGIPLDELPRVWERFYRGESAQREDSRGAGLGLALVKELVEAMGGTVAAESTPGQGSCFTLRLPLARQDWRPF